MSVLICLLLRSGYVSIKFQNAPLNMAPKWNSVSHLEKKGKRKVQDVPQSQTAALPRHREEDETDKTKQAEIEQTYEKHQD